jgi:archaellum biogenesis ATPase FlaH
MENIESKILYLAIKDKECLNKAIQNKLFISLFNADEINTIIAQEIIVWYEMYRTQPSPKAIYEKHQNSSNAAKLKLRFKSILLLENDKDECPNPNEFEYLINSLKLSFGNCEINNFLTKFSEINRGQFQSVDDITSFVKKYGSELANISNKIDVKKEGEYSYTTLEIENNVEKIINKDISTEKRFKIGQKHIDEPTSGLRYGELLLILGNINSGKSMVLTNIAYNLWKDGANVFLLTVEMQPEEFDERIISRASAVNYTNIMNGKEYLKPDEIIALRETAKFIKTKPNQIITKFLNRSDNVGTIAKYLDDLELERGFVPDVVLIDSLEHIEPFKDLIEDKDHLKAGTVAIEFKEFANTFRNGRGCVVISTHQAKTETEKKKFKDIALGDFGRSKIVPENADFALYIRSLSKINTMNVKLIKARRCQVGLEWSMAIDFSKALIFDSEDNTHSENLIDE